jgi:hypothetical protein
MPIEWPEVPLSDDEMRRDLLVRVFIIISVL